MNTWIGVDLDGTLAEYHGWNNGEIGAPIGPMVERVKMWVKEGKQIRILTARASSKNRSEADAAIQVLKITDWCLAHIGYAFPVTCEKDYLMEELWDDRCHRVELNTGIETINIPSESGAFAKTYVLKGVEFAYLVSMAAKGVERQNLQPKMAGYKAALNSLPVDKPVEEGADILSHDDEVRRECGNKAVEYVFFEGDNDPVDENGFQAPSISSDGLRAAIMGKKAGK